jgi:hypothetical protein
MPIQNRTNKHLVIVLSGAVRGSRERDRGDDLTNVQYKPIWNCHNEFPPYNDYILIKINGKNIALCYNLHTFKY